MTTSHSRRAAASDQADGAIGPVLPSCWLQGVTVVRRTGDSAGMTQPPSEEPIPADPPPHSQPPPAPQVPGPYQQPGPAVWSAPAFQRPVLPPLAAKQKKWPWIVGIAAAFVLGVIVGTGSADTTDQPAGQRQQVVAASTTTASRYVPVRTTTTPPPVVMPKPADFAITVHILEKTCFGSAGCNVTYRIEPNYTGASPLPNKEIIVVYEVRGGEDAQINRFTISGGQAEFPSEERISTKSSKAELTAVATQVI